MNNHYIAWWNVENLFDVYNAPPKRRPSYLAKALKSELTGWRAEVLDKKIAQLAWVIKQMNDGAGPDILGVCEVENEYVMNLLAKAVQLPGRDYQVIHHDTTDGRGIDVAFIYDASKYKWDLKIYHHEVLKRSATRDIVQASLITDHGKGSELILIGNHWPSRMGGEYKSAPYRMMAGETLSYWISRIQEIKGRNTAILVMGDFNDDPYSRSLTDYALSTMSRRKVVNGRNPYLYNLMWPLLGARRASYIDGNQPLMLDQFLVSRGIALKSGNFSLDDETIKLEVQKGMVKGSYDTPVRFGRPSKPSTFNEKGYSDHLPISMVLGEK